MTAISTGTARELAIDNVLDRLSEEESESAILVRDGDISLRAVILTDISSYIIEVEVSTRTAYITANFFGPGTFAHDRIDLSFGKDAETISSFAATKSPLVSVADKNLARTLVMAAADLWAGTELDDIKGEYLRGQVELIADVVGFSEDLDHDQKKDLIETAIKFTVVTL